MRIEQEYVYGSLCSRGMSSRDQVGELSSAVGALLFRGIPRALLRAVILGGLCLPAEGGAAGPQQQCNPYKISNDKIIVQSCFSDKDALALSLADDIEIFDLTGSRITDMGVGHLLRKFGITNLRLKSTNITNSVIQGLANEKGLRVLDLSGTSVGGGTLAAVEGGFDSLETLLLRDTAVTQEDLVAFGEMQNLEVLSIAGSAVSTWSKELSVQLSELTILDMQHTLVGGADIGNICKLDKLSVLYAYGTLLDERSLVMLAECLQLQRISFGPSGGTGRAIGAIAASGGVVELMVEMAAPQDVPGIELAESRELEDLTIFKAVVSEELMGHLSQLELKKLSLGSVTWSQGAIARLSELRSLRELVIFDSTLRDEDMPHIGRLVDLQRLSLNGNVLLTDKGIQELENLKDIESLNLGRLQLSEDAIVGLVRKIDKLKSIVVSDDKIKDRIRDLDANIKIYIDKR